MNAKGFLLVLFFLPAYAYSFAQTNVGGVINSNTTWTTSGSPYNITSTVTIRDSAILTIESGVEVIFPGSAGINVGYTSTLPGSLIATGAKFSSTYSSDSRIYFEPNGSSGTLNNCTFDNVYLYVDNSQIAVASCSFDNCNYPISLNDGAGLTASNITFGLNNKYGGIEVKGTLIKDYTLLYNFPVYITGLTVRDSSTLTIESGAKIFFPGTSGIYVGYSSTSTGVLNANGAEFLGISSGDAQIYFRTNSSGKISGCTFNNAYLRIDGASPEISNSKFSMSGSAVYISNNSNPVILNNDFFNNTTALKNTGTGIINAANNYWGHYSGPKHSSNPAGLGETIDGNVSFLPFLLSPVNGEIKPQFTVSVVEVGEAKIGGYIEKEIKFLTSIGDVDLLVTDIQSDNDAFIIKSSKYFWVSKGDTASVKIRFTPASSVVYLGSLKVFANHSTSLPMLIQVQGKGTSNLLISQDTLNFEKVNLKDFKTLSIKLKNTGTSSIRIDSISVTNPDFSYLLGNYPLTINEPAESSLLKKNRSSVNSLAGFYISAGDSEYVHVTFNPSVRSIEEGYLKIYHSYTGVESVYLVAEGYAKPVSIKISGINFQNFPFIYMNAVADTFGQGIESLSKTNFQVYENGILQESGFNVIPPGESGGSRLTDIIFIMDNSGSLGDEQAAVKANVTSFVNKLSASGVDYALGLCRYGSTTNSGNPIIEDNGILTNDPEYFKSSVWMRNNTSGGNEPGYLAIEQSAASFAFRPGAQKVFIIITDESPDQGGATINEALSICKNNSITLFALTYSDLYQYFTPVTSATNGSVYNITTDFNEILTYISALVTSNYIVEYSSSSSGFDNSFREVVIKVLYRGNFDSDTVYYNPLSMPKIQRTAETLKFHEKAWTQGTSFKIQAFITDEYEPFVKFANLHFRRTGQTVYTSLQMSSEGNNLYSAVIPGNYVQSPGIDYYLTASDSQSTSSDPKNQPAVSPYQIAILPNVAPVITHTPIGFAQLNSDVQIDATIVDVTNSVGSAKVYYRKSGQLSYQNISMTDMGSNNYSAAINKSWLTRDGLEYYISAYDDFGLNSNSGTYDSPHKITAASVLLNAQIDTLTIGPSINDVTVPERGYGYCYFHLNYQNNPVISGSLITAKLLNQNNLFEVDGYFVKAGLLRLCIPSLIILDSAATFSLVNQISVGDTLFNLGSSSLLIKAVKKPAEFLRSWDVFAGGSAGVSGTVGSIGAGASAAAAKLSVKGSAGAGLKISKDQLARIFLDRRIEASLATQVSVPSLNGVVGNVTVGQASIIYKTMLGQRFCFSDISLDEDTKKMAQSGFLLETFAIGGGGLSPIAGVILKAIIDVLNASSGVMPIFNNAHLSDYWGAGLEGSVGAGFNLEAGPIKLSALSSTATIALGLKFTDYLRQPNKRLLRYSSLTGNSRSVEFTEAVSFNFSALDFGLKMSDNVELGSGNASLFDKGIGGEIGVTANFDNSNSFDGLSVSLKGGGNTTIFGDSKDVYYNTTIDFPKEYAQALQDAASSLAGFLISGRNIPLGSDLATAAAQSFKNAYNSVKPLPMKVTSSEIRGKGFNFELGIDLDAALLLGAGVSLGINFKYYDELMFPKKVSNIYLNGDNYLLYYSGYSSSMESDNFKDVVKDLLSGILPLVKQAVTNLLNTVTEILIAGQQFVISAITSTGEAVGEVVGVAQDAGEWVVSHFTPDLPSIFQAHPFEPPVFKMMYTSNSLMHPDKSKTSGLASVNSRLVLVSEALAVNFKKQGDSTPLDTVSAPYEIKMVIYNSKLVANGFTIEDKGRISLYYYDDKLQSWILTLGVLNGDTISASTNRLGAFALGIEINSMDDKEAPSIIDYGPKTGSIHTSYPEIYSIVSDNKFGSGLDFSKTFIILNGDTMSYSFNPAESKIYYKLSELDSIKTNSVSVKIICADLAGNLSEVNFNFTLNITGLREDEEIPGRYILYQNYPNPFNPSTTIKFAVPKKSYAEINIYDIRGSYIASVFSGQLEAGYHSFKWNGRNNFGHQVASGIYFYQLKAAEFNEVKKMQVVR